MNNIKVAYSFPKKKQPDIQFYIADLIWKTLIPIGVTILACKGHWIFSIFLIPSILLRMKK